MAAQRFGGRFSPGTRPAGTEGSGEPASPAAPFRGRRARQVSLRARLMFLLPLPLFFAGLGAIGRGDAAEMLAEVGGFAALMLGAWLLNEGLRAEAAYDARKVAKPPSIPRKLFAAALAGLAVFGVGWVSMGQPMLGALAFGLVAGGAHVAAFGLDPMRRKGMEGVDDFASERVARAVDRAEELVRGTLDAAARIGDRPLEARIERLCGQAREVFRAVEDDPRDLGRARTFLTVYLMGLRDATAKFADIYARSRDRKARADYEALLADLETSFGAHRTTLLIEDRSDLDVEIEVLRERLRQDGLTTR
jgi:hypothetical protein